MKPGIPWSVKGIEPEVREAAKTAARRAGMTLGEWLNTVILDQSDDPQAGEQPAEANFQKDSAIRETAPPARARDEGTIRLEDIAQQLSQLAQRERESATIQPYEPPRGHDQDRDKLNRILGRIDSNERRTVEAFTAVNERLSVLGRQIAISTKAPAAPVFDRPEDVPGYAALEGAIRNVVEHIEVSDKRTRDSLRTMQDRMAQMAERATHHGNPEDLVRSAPAFASLESRIAEMASRMERSEHTLQAGLPEIVRKELNQLADRIESVRDTAEQLAGEAQTSAVGMARGELREIESRILGVLKEAQATIGTQQATAADLQRLRGDISGVNQRIDDIQSATASERDVHALRVAVEQLSTRVAQGPDMRPLADMDRRLGDLSRQMEQNHQSVRNLPQFGELERRIAELDHRLGEAVRLQGDHESITALEAQITEVSDRIGRAEQQLGSLETMERAIQQLYESLEKNREIASQTADEAANRAVDRVLAAQQAAGPSTELRALEDGLRAVRESAAGAEQRNQETLEAVHETLEQIVNKLAELETAAAGSQLAANMAQQAAAWQPPQDQSVPQSSGPVAATSHQAQFYDPTGAFHQAMAAEVPSATADEPDEEDAGADAQNASYGDAMPEQDEAEPVVAHGAAADQNLQDGDDFIAAARRAAQAAASRPGVLHPEIKPDMKPGANSRFKLALPFLKRKQVAKAITYNGGRPVAETPVRTSSESKRRKLVLAGIVLLAAVSAFAFNMLSKPPKQTKQSTAIEAPLQPAPAAQNAMPMPAHKLSATATPVVNGEAKRSSQQDNAAADLLETGSLPVRKTDATLTSIVAEPGTASTAAVMPPPDVGSLALRQAAHRGDAKAQFIVASRYLDGEPVAQDLPKAAMWYQQAASQGLAPAQYRLATLFERGKGVPQDVATAFLWYERAATGGNVKAMHNAAVIAAGNQAGTPNYDKAFKWFKSAAEHGLHDSQFNLAVLFERGLGTRIDRPEAYFWYSLAASQGDQDAGKRARGLEESLGADEAAAVAERVKAWSPKPFIDDANVVAITNPVWNDGGEAATVTPEPAPEPATPIAVDPVSEAQELLTKLGFNVGEPDGKMGNRTANAIRLFQLQSGLKVTGEVTPGLLETMREKTS